MSADRELTASILVAAPAEQVWTALTDFGRMPRWSPELVRMLPLRPGGLRVGQWYLGVNRRGAVVWPTRNVVVEVDHRRHLAWDTTSSGARWVYDLEPAGGSTRLTLRRPVPRRLTRLSAVFAAALLGGADHHADELEEGMRSTLEALRAEVEDGAGKHA
jgi:uncharacterized protein YndB with AHSA1/START domain